MISTNSPSISVRDAREADLPALVAIKGGDSEALHRDRFRDALSGGFRYLVLLRGQDVIGSACLVSRRPAAWSDAGDTQHLPQIVDLQVAEARRGQGCGSAFVRAIEREAARAGHQQLFVSVEPADNPRAHALYQRLSHMSIRPSRSTPVTPARRIIRIEDLLSSHTFLLSSSRGANQGSAMHRGAAPVATGVKARSLWAERLRSRG
jgi:GNAT superfamily N-acetyltransferase